jgi:hypothetical protein
MARGLLCNTATSHLFQSCGQCGSEGTIAQFQGGDYDN